MPLNADLGIRNPDRGIHKVSRGGSHQAEGVGKRVIAMPLEGTLDPTEDGELIGPGRDCEAEIEPAGLSEVAPIADPNTFGPSGSVPPVGSMPSSFSM